MIKVAIVDDHKLFREGAHLLIERMEDVNVMFEASNGKELLTKLEDSQPDVILLDLNMPEINGIDTLKILRQQYPKLGVIILTTHSDTKMIVYLMELGANGYLLKDTDPETLHRAIKSVYGEGYFFTNNVSAAKLTSLEGQAQKKLALKNSVTLSPREIEVLELICQEMTAKEKADGHHLDHETIERNRKMLLQKFRAQLHGTQTTDS